MSKKAEFNFNGHEATVIIPDTPAKCRPYIWRTEFLYAFNQADEALLEKGWHIVYCECSDEYGSDYAISEFKKFHDFIVKEYNLNKKASLFGFSRGALYAVNYALKYPEDVALLYLDAPVIDLKSWPGGLGKGQGSEYDWNNLIHNILKIENGKIPEKIDINPCEHLENLADTDIPVLLIAGDSDTVVPYDENGKLLYDLFKKKNKKITQIVKKNCNHHPHSLDNVEVITDFCENSFYKQI